MTNNAAQIDLEQLYAQYFPKVYNFVFYRLLNKEEAEDVVSQVFIKVVRNIDSYDSQKAALSTWIFSIARNAVVDYYRAKKQGVSIDDENTGLLNSASLSVDFEQQYESLASPEKKALYAALAKLPSSERELVYLKYFEHMNNREIGRMLGMNDSTVGTHLMRARKKLREMLKDEIE